MTIVEKSALVPYSSAQMFALVSDVASYPQFLPWCKASEVMSQDEDGIQASVTLSWAGVEKTFVTRNLHQQGQVIDIQLVEGPFKQLEGIWRFEQLGELGSKVTLDLEFSFSSRILDKMVGPVFTQIANSLVESFHKRAQEVYDEG